MREAEPQCILIQKVSTGEFFRYLRGPFLPRGYRKMLDMAIPGLVRRQPVYDNKGNILPEYKKYPMWKKGE